MSENEFVTNLQLMLEEYQADEVAEEIGLSPDEMPSSIRTFDDVGMMSMNKGLVIRMNDGSEFQLTVVRSK